MAKKLVEKVVEVVGGLVENFVVYKDRAVDFLTEEDWKSSASWTDRGSYVVCEFIRSEKDGKKWKELSRSEVILVDVTKLSASVKDFCLRYGLKQILADRNFATPKEEMDKETERTRLSDVEAFLTEVFETEKMPLKRKKGLSEEQKKERKALVDKLAIAMKAKDWALAGKIGDEMEQKGYEL